MMTKIEKALMAAAMAALCLITMTNVVVRYFTNASFAFTEEISVFLLVVMTLVGTSRAFGEAKHIRISFLVDRLPAGFHGVARQLALVAAIGMFALLTWYGALFAYDDWQFETTSPALGIPQWLYSVSLPLLSALIVVRLLIELLRPEA